MKTSAAAVVAALSLAAPAAAASAPGRVVLPVTATPQRDVDAAGGGPAVALPGGGAIVAHGEPGDGVFTLRAVRADGSPDASFATTGAVRVDVGGSAPFQPLELLRQAGGRLLVVGTAGSTTRFALPTLEVVAIAATGAVDRTYGGGVVATGLEASCGGCRPADLAPDGSLVATGNTGAQDPAIAHDPTAPNTFTWALARLTPDGAPDPTFGAGGVLAVPAEPAHDAGGHAVAVLPDGRIVAAGQVGSGAQVVRLLADGRPDPSFHGGAPATAPVSAPVAMVASIDGAATVLGLAGLTRLAADGSVDTAFGAHGVVSTTTANGSPGGLVAAGGGAVLVYRSGSYEPRPADQPDLVITRVDSRGAATEVDERLGFGGGLASFDRARYRILPVPALEQDSFRVSALLPRADGSWLVVGGTQEQQYTGEGAGFSAGQLALAALTPSLALDGSFGGPARPASVRLSLVAQHATSAYRLRGVAVRITASQAGLVLVRVRDGHRRILAEGVMPAWAPGTTTVRVPIAPSGLRYLRHAQGLRVLVGARLRDVLTQAADFDVVGRLR